MSRIDEILAKQKELAEELELAKQQERDAGYSPHLGRCLKVEAMPPWLTSGSA